MRKRAVQKGDLYSFNRGERKEEGLEVKRVLFSERGPNFLPGLSSEGVVTKRGNMAVGERLHFLLLLPPSPPQVSAAALRCTHFLLAFYLTTTQFPPTSLYFG